jgi:hypothetical protein
LVKNGNFIYSDILIMPTYERKYFIGKIVEEYDKLKELQENKK